MACQEQHRHEEKEVQPLWYVAFVWHALNIASYFALQALYLALKASLALLKYLV